MNTVKLPLLVFEVHYFFLQKDVLVRKIFVHVTVAHIFWYLEFPLELFYGIGHFIILLFEIKQVSLKFGIEILKLILFLSVLLLLSIKICYCLTHLLLQGFNFAFLFILGILKKYQRTLRKLFHEHLVPSLEFVFVGALLLIILVEYFKLLGKLPHAFKLRLL